MSERLTPGSFELGPKNREIVRRVGGRALEISEANYCSGFPDFRGGSIKKLAYHNARHNRSVGDGAVLLGERLGLSVSEQELARTAGYAHDLVQLKGRGNDERESAEWVERQLREGGIDPAAAKLAGLAILGTLPLFENNDYNGRVIGQTANSMEFTSKRDELFVKSVAAADLGELYTPMGPLNGHLLYAQRHDAMPEEAPDMQGLADFQENQLKFLTHYHYPLVEANEVLATHRSQVIRYAEHLLERLKDGSITTWDEVMAMDKAFLQNPDMHLG